MTHPAEDLLGALSERQRDEVVAAWAAVEYGREPVDEVGFAALRDPALRETLRAVLRRTGRDLVRIAGRRWTSGYDDDVRAELVARGWGLLPEYDRAVLTTILVHSVAIPRSDGHLTDDSWASAVPTTVAELRSHTQLARGKLNDALQRLRSADLIRAARTSSEGASYVPGPQFHRLTPAARRLLQEELVLAAGPGSPLAAAIRHSRGGQQ
ncbi:hypothetical protein [Cryptosporangium phraense]|uniref:Uncharacterized protein n=1 Tax=Cryptosporangium phraense TaxID=2593070 RepID=A0A545AHW2_9ACTN|nr:hypothetical protein [Cryptosporangium phraense]TQS40913.1 hypothetical protein FL583_32325 [Cryptosporangium phraense]